MRKSYPYLRLATYKCGENVRLGAFRYSCSIMSNNSVTEIITLNSNDAMKTTSNFQEAIALMRHSAFDGIQRMHWGDRVQQPGIRQWFTSEAFRV